MCGVVRFEMKNMKKIIFILFVVICYRHSTHACAMTGYYTIEPAGANFDPSSRTLSFGGKFAESLQKILGHSSKFSVHKPDWIDLDIECFSNCKIKGTQESWRGISGPFADALLKILPPALQNWESMLGASTRDVLSQTQRLWSNPSNFDDLKHHRGIFILDSKGKGVQFICSSGDWDLRNGQFKMKAKPTECGYAIHYGGKPICESFIKVDVKEALELADKANRISK